MTNRFALLARWSVRAIMHCQDITAKASQSLVLIGPTMEGWPG